jgi:hypothetical protein
VTLCDQVINDFRIWGISFSAVSVFLLFVFHCSFECVCVTSVLYCVLILV